MSDSVWPHRRQPTRLPRPWDSPGKNTGVGCHFLLQCIKVKSESEVTQSCPTLPDPMDCSLPGSSFLGVFQARVLEWGAIAFSGKGTLDSHKRDGFGYDLVAKITGVEKWKCQSLSHVWLFLIPWTIAHQTPLSMGFPRRESWSGLHFLL